jgi:hypothetical protein
MAWVDVTGSSSVWQYENAATITHTYPDSADGANSVIASGVRTYTKADSSTVQTYIRTRLKGEINLLSYSEDFSNGSWAKLRSTVVANAGVAPDGNTTAWNSIPDSGAQSNVQIYKGGTYVSKVFSVYAKPNGFDYVSVVFQAGVSNSMGVQFNVSTGAIAVSNDATGTIADVGNGWYRCSIIPTTSTSSSYAIIQVSDGGTPGNYFNTAVTGDGSKGVLVWGAQVNEGPNLRRYIKTVASASTTIERGELSKTYYDGQ